MASKKEILSKTEAWVKSKKEDLDRILHFVKTNKNGMGYEQAMAAIQSIASNAYDLAQSFRQWANDDRQGKLEESKEVAKTFRKYLKESVLQTQNEAWGFFGTISNEFDHNTYANAKEAWKIAFQEVQKATGWTDVEVRVWLDSKDGRHFADQCADFGAANDMRDGISQAAKFYRERKWFNKI